MNAINIEIHPAVDCVVKVGKGPTINVLPPRSRHCTEAISDPLSDAAGQSRFVHLDSGGHPNGPGDTAEDHCLTQDNETGLIWTQTLDGRRMTHAEAAKACASVDAMGGGFRLPTIQELLSLVDYERRNPAINADYFPDTKPNWYWSSSLYAGNPGFAWVVYSDGGNSPYVHRVDDGHAFVRAVRGPVASAASQ